VLSVLCVCGMVVVTDLLLFFLGVLLHLGVEWKHGSSLGISGGTHRGGGAAAGEGGRSSG
jgi:hypothetical protein